MSAAGEIIPLPSAGGSWDAMVAHELQRAVELAALQLAVSIDVSDRIATDPDYAADRSDWADRERAAQLQTALQRYRDAVRAAESR